jgi:hypothetical protein
MLFTPTDLSTERNIDLTSDGEGIVATLISAVTAWASSVASYPIEQAAAVYYVEDGANPIHLPTMAPVSGPVVSFYNTQTNVYDAVDVSLVRAGGASVYLNTFVPCGFQAVKVDYTAGWTAETLPSDLRDALMNLVMLKLEQINNLTVVDASSLDASQTATGALKKVQTADGYSEEYDVSESTAVWKAKAALLARSIGDDVPAGIMEVVSRYRLVFAL